MNAVSVICPFHNEKDNLEGLCERAFRALGGLYNAEEIELILVDDASTDGAAPLIGRLLEKYSNLKVITHAKRMGQAAALSSGFNCAGGRIIVTMDADLQVYPEDLPLFLNKINEGYDVVNGIRLNRKEGLFLRLSSRIFSLCVGLALRTPVSDAASNFTAARSEFISGLNLAANDHRYIIPILKKRGAARFAEVDIRHAKRQKGKTKYRLTKVILAIPEYFSFYRRFSQGYYDRN